MTIAPYGSWRSPITSDAIAAESLALGEPSLDGSSIYWLEGRPREGGRVVIRRLDEGKAPVDVLPAPFSARTRVHEYGGGAYAVTGDAIYFSNFSDQQVYRVREGSVTKLTDEPGRRYADFDVDPVRHRIVCVREDHTDPGGAVVNEIVAISLTDGRVEPLARGNDFYSTPRVSPDGRSMAWLSWNHPDMPWTNSELRVCDLDSAGVPRDARRVAGGAGESVFQPDWSPQGTLYFVSDRTDWWNLYRLKDGATEPLAPMEADFGLPQWIFRMSTFAFESPERLVCAYVVQGRWKMAILELPTGRFTPLDLPYEDFGSVRAVDCIAVFRAGSPASPSAIVRLDLSTLKATPVAWSVAPHPEWARYFSTPEAIEFPTTDQRTAHAFYYAPKNPDFTPPPNKQPPLLVRSHGGPTAATSSTLDLRTQFWTSRGFAVVDVNYGGSTGYGREYRFQLENKWGIVDVDDSVHAAEYVARRGLADPARMAIVGSSAGGYTTLCALTFRSVFAAGASYYGVSDLESLARHTHKFESRYLDWLIGPYPERMDLYRERSPIHFVERLTVPVAFFQGEEDEVVPPEQTARMAAALCHRGVLFTYLLFGSEQHGFRRAENIRMALEAELLFYAAVLLRRELRF